VDDVYYCGGVDVFFLGVVEVYGDVFVSDLVGG